MLVILETTLMGMMIMVARQQVSIDLDQVVIVQTGKRNIIILLVVLVIAQAHQLDLD